MSTPRRLWRTLPVLLALAAGLPLAPEAQTAVATAPEAEVVGTVTSDGQPVPLATVRLVGTDRGTAADAEGRFRLPLAPGPFALEVSAVGFETARREGAVSTGETLRLDVDLERVTIRAGDVVVTAARGARAREDVPVPTTVVTAEAIEEQGALRLSDVLETLPGVVLGDAFGAGVQLQGLDPDYTLILIDGEPVVGRTAGVLDLERITLAGVERVEVVRGPSSSLYGSEALAGVINVVTAAPGEPSARLRARYGSFDTAALTAEASGTWPLAGRDLGVRLVLDGYGSAGYDLDPEAYGQTTPVVTDGTADLRLAYALSSRTDLRLGGRLGRGEGVQSYLFADVQGALDEIDQTETRTDWSARTQLAHRLSPRLTARASGYATGYRLDTEVRRQATGQLTYDDLFDQRLWRGEAQLDGLWNAHHRTLLGAGANRDALAGGRYGTTTGAQDSASPEASGAPAAPRATTLFAFAQHEWRPTAALDVTASARYDTHSDFGGRLSPKLAALVRPGGAGHPLRLRASVGSGFKAPDPRQLYLSFTNAVGGYEIFGAARVAEGLDRLEAQGRLARRYVDVALLEAIAPETSLSVDAEVQTRIGAGVNVTLGAFRNDVEGLIDVQPVGELQDGGPVYSYVNLGRVRTEGATAAVELGLWRDVRVSAGYQWLRSRDRDLADEIARGAVFGRTVGGRDVRLGLADYTNLFGRSAHTGTLRLTARPGAGLTLTALARARSRYGLRDLDGNGLANRADEFVPATALLDLTLGRAWPLGRQRLLTQVGVENALGTTRPALVPSLPGRRLWASVEVRF